jgi:hypothetical protein
MTNATAPAVNSRILNYRETFQIRLGLEKQIAHLKEMVDLYTRYDNLKEFAHNPKKDLEDAQRVLEALNDVFNVLRLGEIGKI